MNTLQLTSLARSCPSTNRFFRGVFASDTLPITPHPQSTYICNLDSSDKPGTHWIAFFVPKDDDEPVEYFDSYGFPAPPLLFDGFLRDTYVFNTRCLQHLASAVCGQYCLFYIWLRPLCPSMDSVLSVFDDDLQLYNDLLVNYLIETHFGVDLHVFDESFAFIQTCNSFLA